MKKSLILLKISVPADQCSSVNLLAKKVALIPVSTAALRSYRSMIPTRLTRPGTRPSGIIQGLTAFLELADISYISKAVTMNTSIFAE